MEASGRWLNDFISMLLGKLKIEFIMLLGNKIKSLRDEQGILQRQVAAYLEIVLLSQDKKKHTTESFPFQLCALIIY